MKVLFLDIDGVLNSTRTAIACRGVPHNFTPACRNMFDEVAIMLLRGLCEHADIKVVVSSSWRIGRTHEEIGQGLQLPTIGVTPSLPAVRGAEIAAWLAEHPEVEQYAILDDDDDMLPGQAAHFVKTNGHEGLTYECFLQLCEVFGINAYDTAPPSRTRNAPNFKLDWTDA